MLMKEVGEDLEDQQLLRLTMEKKLEDLDKLRLKLMGEIKQLHNMQAAHK